MGFRSKSPRTRRRTGETNAQDPSGSRGSPASVAGRVGADRRGGQVDRRSGAGDRRGGPADRRGAIADRRGAVEARYRAPRDAQFHGQLAAWQERERTRVAADLHDSIGSSLCTIRLKLQEATGRIREEAPQCSPAPLEEIASDIATAMDEVRRVARDLRPAILDDLGIVATIGWLCRELERSQTGVRIAVQCDLKEADVPNPLKTPVFRILQEGLNNTLKHSGARNVRVALGQVDDELRLTIEDDGKGLDVVNVLHGIDGSQHFGILNMRHRANSSGGSLSIRSSPGEGVVLTCAWPRTTG